jgi:DNA ligase-1
MLAGKLTDIDSLVFPVYCTEKLDGIRCLKVDGKVLSRKFKEIPNHHIRKMLSVLPDGVDGELILMDGNKPAQFNKVSSAVMSEDGKPDIIYFVFDFVSENLDKPYVDRMKDMEKVLKNFKFCKLVIPTKASNREELDEIEERFVNEGYEGVMIRSGNGPYKLGRSTEREGYLLKLKRFEDSEATVTGFEEKMHNENEATRDELGHTKRSHAKAGMVPAGTLGTLLVKDMKTGIEFGIGSGFDDILRKEIWNNKNKYLGKIVKYKHQPSGKLEKPRFPVYLGWRDERDMD